MGSIRFSISLAGRHGGVGISFVPRSAATKGAVASIPFMIYGCSTKSGEHAAACSAASSSNQTCASPSKRGWMDHAGGAPVAMAGARSSAPRIRANRASRRGRMRVGVKI